ncbi:prostacyclin synthase isoform X1 [Oncorhynchus kisutch]|uniref:prostacyclin synthase isoform X1 n=1 Tax=Oncorhynchus kisutch TaxID=8019 RepID=UPI00099FDC18|nr:prostacyclin synthase isoform X1 [Oncorhynchus kisutch]
MIWTILLIVQGILILFILVSKRSRSEKEPPLDKGVIPWLGHALEFGRDASKFLTRMKVKHGDIFTVRVAGRYVTVLLDPSSYDAVIEDSVSLDFTRYAQVLMDRIFSLRLPHHNPAVEKAMMKQHFEGESLSCLSSTMHCHLQSLLLQAQRPCHNQTDWNTDGLFSFCYSLLFRVFFTRGDRCCAVKMFWDVRAGYLTHFEGEQKSNRTDPIAVYVEYRKFDNLLTKMARTMLKPEEKRTAHSVRVRLWDLLAPAGLGEGSGSSTWLRCYRHLLQEEGADEETQRRALLLQLWATQGNVGPAAFWLLGFLLTNPEAMRAVKKEFSKISGQDSAQCPLLDRLQHTPVFDSALEETLRLSAAPFITREVVQAKTLHMADGQEYKLRSGDRVCLFPFISPQMDPEIHQEPQRFKYDRFLNQEGSVKKDFFKGGRRLKYYTMPWGAGTNGCVGKHFAISSIRQFVYLVLSHLELELCDPEAQMPEVNSSRYGFGMLQPEGDLAIRYKPRRSH